MPEPQLDVLVRGAGPVGCALALALDGSGLRTALAGRRRASGGTAQAVRPIALSYGSRLILERIRAWDGMQATPIEDIHVSPVGRLRAHPDLAR